MKPVDNPFEKHQELIAFLMLSHMSSFSVMTYLTSMLGHAHVLSSEAFGALSDRQRESLDVVINNSKKLQEHLDVFIIATRLMFTPDRYYEIDCDLLGIINSVIEQIRKTTEFQIETDFPDNIPLFKADANLLSHAIDCLRRIIKQIHPTQIGRIKIVVRVDGNLVRIIFSTNKDEFLYPRNENPDLFIVQAIAELHGGEFVVDTSDEADYKLIFTFSTAAFS